LLGVCNVHNHFHLKENEVVLAEARVADENDQLNNFDVKMTSPNYLHLKATTLENKAKPVPYMWAFDKESKMFFALHFFDGSNKKMKDRFQEIAQRRDRLVEFYQEFVELANKQSAVNNLGIYILYADLFKKNSNIEQLREITNLESREQWVFTIPTEEVQKSITTHWSFQSNYDGSVEVVCMQVCTNIS